MARKIIYEVFARIGEGPVSLGFFTDDFLATQTVNHLYERLRAAVVNKDFSVAVITEQVKPVGWDQWVDTNKRNDPVFFFRPANLYNAVPTNVTNFSFVEESDVIPF